MDRNRVDIIGRLGADPEIKSFQNGGRIANLRVATSEKWTDKQTGEKKDRTEWHSVTIRGDGLIGVVERYLKKGSHVAIVGKLQTRKWQDSSGNDRYTTEIVVAGIHGELIMFGGTREQGSGSGGQSSGGGRTTDRGGRYGGDYAGGGGTNDGFGGTGAQQRAGGGFSDDLDDDIPFARNDLSHERRCS